MDTLLSQLKGQGSPFLSPLPISNVDKLLDTIHLLSQATVLVAHQLQEQKSPVTAKPPKDVRPLVRPPTSFPTPKPSPPPTGKKAPPPNPSPAPMLPWVLRNPEYYRLTPPNSTTTTLSSVATHSSVPIPKPTLRTPHTKKDRKPKSKRINPSTQPNPSPNPPTPTTPRPALPDQPGPFAPLTPSPTSRSAQSDQCKPPNPPPNPLPTPSPTSGSAQSDQRAEKKAAKAARAAAIKAKNTAAPTPTPTPPTKTPPTPPPSKFEDAVAPIAPANNVVNYPHTYDGCPRLPECPAHKVEFAVYSQAYADRTRDTPHPRPIFPYSHAGPGFELRCERDTAWWPVPPSDTSSPPGTPADPDAFLFPPPDDDPFPRK